MNGGWRGEKTKGGNERRPRARSQGLRPSGFPYIRYFDFLSTMSSSSSSSSATYPDIQVTHTAPSNIACIKYWGKRDIRMNTPINSSVSVTMNQDDLKAITTITASKSFDKDQLWLNGQYVDNNYGEHRYGE